jgi:hypothetical protein
MRVYRIRGSQALAMNSIVFWDIILHNLFKIDRCFGGICRLHIQNRMISQVRNQHQAGNKKSTQKLRFV